MESKPLQLVIVETVEHVAQSRPPTDAAGPDRLPGIPFHAHNTSEASLLLFLQRRECVSASSKLRS